MLNAYRKNAQMSSRVKDFLSDPPYDPCMAKLLDAKIAEPVAEALRSASKILVVTHRNPDGDAIGSAVAVVLALEAMGKDVYGYCPGPLLAHFLDLPQIGKLSLDYPQGQSFDLTLVLDCGDLERVSEDFKPSGLVVNIDHHGTNPMFGDLNWVDANSAATGEMVFALLRALKVRLTPDIAQNLYLAIITDTGSFRHSNTRPETFHLAGCLMAAGAVPDEAARLYWDNNTLESTRLRGEVLARLELRCGGKIAWSQLTAEQLAAHGGAVNEPEGLSGQLRAIRGVEVGLLFTEVDGEGVRMSFRSTGEFDVAEIAGVFGGGGHRAAAGAFVKGPLEKVREDVLAALERALGSVK